MWGRPGHSSEPPLLSSVCCDILTAHFSSWRCPHGPTRQLETQPSGPRCRHQQVLWCPRGHLPSSSFSGRPAQDFQGHHIGQQLTQGPHVGEEAWEIKSLSREHGSQDSDESQDPAPAEGENGCGRATGSPCQPHLTRRITIAWLCIPVIRMCPECLVQYQAHKIFLIFILRFIPYT